MNAWRKWILFILSVFVISFGNSYWVPSWTPKIQAEDEDEEQEQYEEQEEEHEEEHEEEDDDYEEERSVNGDTQPEINKPGVSPTTKPVTITKKMKVYRDGMKVNLNFVDYSAIKVVQLEVVEGQPYVPATVIFKVIDVPYSNFSNSPYLEFYVLGHDYIFRTDSPAYYDNGNKILMPRAIFKLNNEIYVPLNVLAEQLRYDVNWNGVTGAFDWKRVK